MTYKRLYTFNLTTSSIILFLSIFKIKQILEINVIFGDYILFDVLLSIHLNSSQL